jgi:hypothetical protein
VATGCPSLWDAESKQVAQIWHLFLKQAPQLDRDPVGSDLFILVAALVGVRCSMQWRTGHQLIARRPPFPVRIALATMDAHVSKSAQPAVGWQLVQSHSQLSPRGEFVRK